MNIRMRMNTPSNSNSVHSQSAIDLAKQVGDSMFAVDTATKDTMGMALLSCEPGRAVIRMEVKELHLNGHKICHGGFIFTLADSTFAFACNSHNQKMVAAGAEIYFLAPAQEGDTLTAEGREQHRAGRSGLYDVRVTDQIGRTVALFRGKSAAISGAVIPGTDPAPSKASS